MDMISVYFDVTHNYCSNIQHLSDTGGKNGRVTGTYISCL